MNRKNNKVKIEIPEGYIPGMFRGENGDNMKTHLYKGSFDKIEGPMCSRGWQYGDSYSIFRNNVSKKGICKICLRRSKLNLSVK